MSQAGTERALPPAPEPSDHSAQLRAGARLMATGAGAGGSVVALAAVVVAAGWLFGLPGLTHPPGMAPMKLSTALCLVGLGSAITLSARAELTGSARSRRLGLGLAALVGLAAVGVLVEDAFGLTSPLDNPFGLDPGDAHTLVPGRMAALTAASLLGFTLALALTARRLDRTAHAVTLVVLTVASPALVGYEYGVRTAYGFDPFDTIDVLTGAALVLAGSAVLFLRPGAGILSLLVGDSAGAVLTRLIAPWIALGPNLIGAVVAVSLRHRGYAGPFALAIVVTVLTIAGTVLVWFLGEQLRAVDQRRGGAEDALAVAEDALAERDRVQRELAVSVRRTRRILATAADAYIAIDVRGNVTDWNDAATGVFGWTHAEAVGERLENLIIPSTHAAAHQAGLARFLQSGDAPILGQQLELEAVNRSGARIPVELTVWADTGDSVEGFHAFVRDITTRKRAEQNLRRLNADLAEFAAIAAHDLRSPLATIQMQVDLVLGELESGWGREETREWVTRIGRTADRGVELIDDLLAYASIGQEGYAARPVDLEALAREVADAQLGAAGRPARCTVERLPVVAGDGPLLRQLVANLVGNAIKYVPADRMPEVVVDALVLDVDGRCVLRVSDNGTGFDGDERERVFEMFQRGRGSSTVPGTGIGLAICRRVAERHGGRIWIDPSAPTGSRICVELPLWTGSFDEVDRRPGRSDVHAD